MAGLEYLHTIYFVCFIYGLCFSLYDSSCLIKNSFVDDNCLMILSHVFSPPNSTLITLEIKNNSKFRDQPKICNETFLLGKLEVYLVTGINEL